MTRALRSCGRALLSLVALSSLAAAACPSGCDSLTPVWGYAENGGVDPKDGSFQQLLIAACPCFDQEPLINSIIYTGIDNQVTTAVDTVIMQSANQPTTITHQFPTATNTLFLPGATVGVQYAVFENGNTLSYGRAYYTYSPVTSITYVESTQTVVLTSVVSTTTTATQTATSTSTISQQTRQTPCTSGTRTVTGSPSTSTVRSTITKPPVIKTTTSVTTVTVHASCVRSWSKKPRRDETADRLARRQAPNAGVGEQPWFPADQGNPAQSTYTTGTSIETDTTTVTSTATQTATTTTTVTSTPTPLTTTICSSVQATSTITPTVTVTSTTKVGGSTTTRTSTYTLTTTVWAHHPPPICSPSCPSHPWPHWGRVLKPTATKT